jgi:hypothetical protein
MARKHNLAEVLQTEVSGSMPLKTLAKVLASKGRRGDTMLAHITPKEAKKLKKMGGSGTTNPETGLPEFFEDFGAYDYTPIDVPYEASLSTDVYPQQSGTGVYVAETPGQTQLAEQFTGQVQDPIMGSQGQLLLSQQQQPYLDNLYQSAFTSAPQTMTGLQPGYSDRPLQDIQAQIQAAAGGGAVSLPGATGDQQKDIIDAVKKAADTSGKTDEEKSTLDKLLSSKNALGLGILGAGGLMGYLNQQRAAEQAKNAAAQIQAAYAQAAQSQKDLAQPLIGPGYTQLSQALQGALSPANQQAYQAAQARAAQASARSGGVGAVQTSLQEEAFRQQLLASQQQQALALLAPGNAMLQAAINAQLQGTTQGLTTRLGLEQQANQAAMGLYAALGSAVGGGLLKS